ncbi:DUF4190 domain-containing protein [Antribacter sp. KLBMP9083]|uniref:DUF4190 domain-containing protein n=1 Tax=Antribacter soli TaxID=2910976 RepID=A0AA41U650_9MICO|nr:DUF4190 domain-containing protein [Antribacter soli]MCF4120688.1 DUF4190 domain-containing protein [Antribacter soli]
MSTHPEGPAPDPYSTQPHGSPAPPAAPGYVAPPTPPGYVAPPTPPGYVASPTPPGYATNPGYPPPPGVPGSPYPTQQPSTDGLAIAALVTGILSLGIIPIILGALALSRIKKSGQSGRGMAIAGIVLGALGIFAWVALIIFFVAVASTDEFQESFEQSYSESFDEATADASAEATEDTEDLATDLATDPATDYSVTIGECFAMPPADDIDLTALEVQDCAGPHDAEFYAVQELPSGEYPGEESIFTSGDDYCLTEFNTYVGIDYDDSEFDFGYFYPTAKSWAFGDREINCYAATVDGSQLTGSVQGIAR